MQRRVGWVRGWGGGGGGGGGGIHGVNDVALPFSHLM